MTTTLRPSAPLRLSENGGRSRPFEVCVNSRRVGRVELSTDPTLGPSVGRIEDLFIDERDRHRGRATVAALAAEEVLRGWGCRQIATAVPAGATTALGLAGALGYGERGRNMVKHLDEEPALPEGCQVRPIGGEEYPAWYEARRDGFLRRLVERGVPEDTARAKSFAEHEALLPEGPASPGVVLRVLAHAGTDVGTLWVSMRAPGPDDGDAYVFDVRVDEPYQGLGHGRTLMLVGERESLAAGARTLGLFVFGGNVPALRLYESLGYRATQYHLFKALL